MKISLMRNFFQGRLHTFYCELIEIIFWSDWLKTKEHMWRPLFNQSLVVPCTLIFLRNRYSFILVLLDFNSQFINCLWIVLEVVDFFHRVRLARSGEPDIDLPYISYFLDSSTIISNYWIGYFRTRFYYMHIWLTNI